MAYIFGTMKRAWLIPLVVAIAVVIGLFVWRAIKFDRLFAGNYPELAGGVYDAPVAVHGEKYLVPPDEIYDSGLGVDGTPAINDPQYVDTFTADEVLADEIFGLDVEVEGTHYFYPYQILNWHEVVNAKIGGRALAITYSTLCGTPIVYERTLGGQEVELMVSGKVYNSVSLLTDGKSSTLWNQATGQAIVGQEVGQQLTRYPSIVMSWANFKSLYASGQVLSADTGFAREYGRHPYGGYETSATMFFPVNNLNSHLGAKEIVFDVTNGQEHAAYSLKYLGFQQEPNLTLGEGEEALGTVAMMNYTTKVTKVFNREVDGQMLTFVRDDERFFIDNETGSTWGLDGLAVDGELAGTQLEQLIAPASYAFCYSAMYPKSVISGDELFDWDGDGVVEGEGEGEDASQAPTTTDEPVIDLTT